MSDSPTAKSLAPELLLTAAQAYPRFEQLMLDAKREIHMGFRVFDPLTPLYSEAAQAIGDTWFDLIVYTLKRGVTISIVISDFDPVIRPEGHFASWKSLRVLFAAGEASGRPDLLTANASMHPAQAGLLPRLMIWPMAWNELRKTAKSAKRKNVSTEQFLMHRPYLRENLKAFDGGMRAKMWPIPRIYPATHHQKLAVFDRETLYVGGLDLDQRRFDTPKHDRPAADTWHDAQVVVTGKAAEEAAIHLESFQALTSTGEPPKLIHLLRTLSQKRRFKLPYLSPRRKLTELAEAHFDAASDARHLIYLETQFFRDKHFATHLYQMAKAKPDLTLLLVLPAAPEDVAFEGSRSPDAKYGEYMQAKAVSQVVRGFGHRVFIASPAQARRRESSERDTHHKAPIVYVHAKVSVFDDESAIVSSANINGRSFRWDTEVGLRFTGACQTRPIRLACFGHWLKDAQTDATNDLNQAVATWRDLALSNAASAPEERRGLIIPYDPAAARDLGMNLPAVPQEAV